MRTIGPWCVSLLALAVCVGPTAAGGWPTFEDQTDLRLVADPAVGALDEQEKDYAWGDVDGDGDVDLVVARKVPFTQPGGRRNVLFLNEGIDDGQAVDGVLVDRTQQYVPAFGDPTNDRDVILADVNGDAWPDIVTAVTLGGLEEPKSITHPRVYINRGLNLEGDWLGFVFDDVDRIPTMPFEPRFNAVAAGDVDGDGDLDLYFVDSDSGPYGRAGDLDDRLLANDGAGYFTDVTADALTPQMLDSFFGTAVAIEDINGDEHPDIVKSEQGPVEIYYNAGDGTFDELDPVYTGAGYYVSVGHLDDDGMLDLVVTDDGTDRYLLNQGNDAMGIAEFNVFAFPSDTNGFGDESLIVDLDDDSFNDVIVADVAIDIPGCQRVADILRNDANPPSVTFSNDPSNISVPDLQGVHAMAVFDIDRDGDKDMVLGRCASTEVWMNAPPLNIGFSYPNGLPVALAPDEPTPIVVAIKASGELLDLDSPTLHVSVDGGPFESFALDELAFDQFVATIPPVACPDRVDFYLSAALAGGTVFTDPPLAPASTYGAVATSSTVPILDDPIEGDVSAWTVANDPSLVSGAWEQADPNGTVVGDTPVAPEDDASPDGTRAFVTENGPPGGNAAANDVDGGPTYLISPAVDVDGADGIVSYARWAASVFGVEDPLTVEISNDGGASWTIVETVSETGGVWQTASFIVSDVVVPSGQIQLRFSICDCPNDSTTEAGIDDVVIIKISCASPCPWDLDADGIVGITDLLDLLAGWGDPYGIADLLGLLADWGPCPS